MENKDKVSTEKLKKEKVLVDDPLCFDCGLNATRCSLPKELLTNDDHQLNVVPTYCVGGKCNDPSGYIKLFDETILGLTLAASFKVSIGSSLTDSYVCVKLTVPVIGDLVFEVSTSASVDYHFTTPFFGEPYYDFVAYIYEKSPGTHCLHVCSDLKVPLVESFNYNDDVFCFPF